MSSMIEVIVDPSVNLSEQITFSFTNTRSSGCGIIVNSVSQSGVFASSGISKGDELMSFSGLEASKFKDIKEMLSALEATRYPNVKFVFFREKGYPQPSPAIQSQVNKSPNQVPAMDWVKVDTLNLRTSTDKTYNGQPSSSSSTPAKDGPFGKWLNTTAFESTSQNLNSSNSLDVGGGGGEGGGSDRRPINNQTAKKNYETTSGEYSDVKFVGDLHKQPCQACHAPWMEQSGFFTDGNHSRCCRNCGVSYCSDCKYAHMVKTKGSGSLDMSFHSAMNASATSPSLAETVASPNSGVMSKPVVRRHTFNERTLNNLLGKEVSDGGGGLTDTGAGVVSSAAYKSQWLCRSCALDCGVEVGQPCSVCQAPWTDKSSFMGANSQHSRECKTCHKSFCHKCKKTNMVREKTADTIRQTFNGRSYDKQKVGVFASFSSRLSFSVNGEDEYEASARKPLHQYECLNCRAEHMYKPLLKTEGDNSKSNSRRASAPSLNETSSTQKRNLVDLKKKKQAAAMKKEAAGMKDWMKSVTIQVVNGEKLGIDMSKELVITRVFPDSLAAKAGLREGWAVLEIDGVQVINLPSAQRALTQAFMTASSSFNIIVSTTGR